MSGRPQLRTRGHAPFESDHAFDGFSSPFSNSIQFKDPRSLTEARGIFLAAWSDPAMPLGDTTAQVDALQLRGVVTERLQEFAGDIHAIVRFGQNLAMNVLNSGSFMTSTHLDKRFGRFVPFYEANWFYDNQNGQYLPTLGIEGGGLINLGAGQVMGLSYVTNAVGFRYDLSDTQILGLGYEFQVSQPIMLFNNYAMCQYIWRY